jgi:hypothetical protein
MTQLEPGEPAQEAPRPSADPTRKVARPPIPGRAVRADVAAGILATPPIHHDQPTVAIPGSVRETPRRTLEFGVPTPVNVTVGPRPRPRRRYRTWPWILAVVLALVVLGTVLLVMMLRGASVDADVDLVGSVRQALPAIAVSGAASGA